MVAHLFAWIVDDDGSGRPGIPAFYNEESQMWMPLVTSREEVAHAMEPHAKRIADSAGSTIRLYRFDRQADPEYTLYSAHPLTGKVD